MFTHGLPVWSTHMVYPHGSVRRMATRAVILIRMHMRLGHVLVAAIDIDQSGPDARGSSEPLVVAALALRYHVVSFCAVFCSSDSRTVVCAHRTCSGSGPSVGAAWGQCAV